jgi:pentatricopeptide repeat protein
MLESWGWNTTLLSLVDCLGRLGRWDEARAAAAQLLKQVPDFSISSYRAMTPQIHSPMLERSLQVLEQAGVPA